MARRKKNPTPFLNKTVHAGKWKTTCDFDLPSLYERAYEELALQQAKRDQIITIYLAVFSFLVPFALSMDILSWQSKGLILLAVAIIGVFFSLIIIRYRIYKEAYWLCCQSLTVLMNLRPEEIDKATIQGVYYQSLYKKGHSYVIEKPGKPKRFHKWKYVKKNLFSAETMHFIIQALITSILFGLSVALILSLDLLFSVLIGVVAGLALLLVFLKVYFDQCCDVYRVLVDDSDEAFNKTFSKAWFLHFYV